MAVNKSNFEDLLFVCGLRDIANVIFVFIINNDINITLILIF